MKRTLKEQTTNLSRKIPFANKTFYIRLSVLFILIGLAIGYSTQYFSSQKSQGQAIYQVKLLKNKADPDLLRIKTGSYVQFDNKDGKKHAMSTGKGSGYGYQHNHESGVNSPLIGTDEGYRIQLKKVGIYNFHDDLNPQLHTTVIVYEDNRKK